MLYKELQSVDSYQILLSHPFSNYDRKLLSLFYQPLIGSNAMSLFMTFWADAEGDKGQSYTHHHLMNLLSMPLGTIFEARIALEAIGLLRTYRKREGDSRSFQYELLPPLDAQAFFNDPLLSTFLFSKIGENAYRNLRSKFIVEVEKLDDYVEVSRSFLDVYQSSIHRMNQVNIESEQLQAKKKSMGVPFGYAEFDFQLLQSGLSEQMIPQATLASVSRELIAKLAFLYSINAIDMQKVVMIAMDEDMQLKEERLRKAASDFYKMNISTKPPIIENVVRKPEPVKTVEEPSSRTDQLVQYLESTSPVNMLRHLNGKVPLSVDVQLAERLIHTHGLSTGVVNVLFQYVYYRNDGKITNNFVERIASHWMNKKIETAAEAMELARNEHDTYMQWKNEGQKPSQRRSANKREEKVPEWFYKREEKQEEKTNIPNFDVEAERQQLLRELGVTTETR